MSELLVKFAEQVCTVRALVLLSFASIIVGIYVCIVSFTASSLRAPFRQQSAKGKVFFCRDTIAESAF